jgi:N-carbamoylputrescine amidase
MMQITVALLQMMACSNDKEANLVKGEEFCRRASAMGADIALFPEMWSAGYTPACKIPESTPETDLWRAPQLWENGQASSEEIPDPGEVWRGLAISRDDPFVEHFRALARELNMAIALTYLEQWPDAPRNTMSLIDRHGEMVMTYAKVHTCDFGPDEAALTPGDDFFVCSLDTAQGEIKVGAMICYDREFPESARILMLKGAELILVPNACDLEQHRLEQFRTRACENQVALAMTNYAGPTLGHSTACDPIAFKDGHSRDILVVEAGENEGIYLAPFDMDAIREYRVREAWGNAFRRPHRYGLLTSLDVQEPFVRVNANGEVYDRSKR